MDVCLQPSYARTAVDTVMAYQKQAALEMHAVPYHLLIRGAYIATALVGVVQVIHTFAVWVIMSTLDIATLGITDAPDKIADGAGAMCASGLLLVAVSVSNVFYSQAANVLMPKIIARAEQSFGKLGEEFMEEFDKQAEVERIQREARALERRLRVRPDLYSRELRIMRSQRLALWKQCRQTYNADRERRYATLVDSQAKMSALLHVQRKNLVSVPYSQQEIDSYFTSQTEKKADEVSEELRAYPIAIWTERKAAWDQYGWNGEAFAEQALKLFKKESVSKEIESLVQHVKNAGGKEHAFKRFVKDINSLKRKVKGQIDRTEHPSIFRRAWWYISPWVDNLM